jgi:hypothetical protein
MSTYKFPLTPCEALDYLAEHGVSYRHVASLRNLRRRDKIESQGVKDRTTLWAKEELDALIAWKMRKQKEAQTA